MPGAGKSLNWWIIISSLCLFISAPDEEENEVWRKELNVFWFGFDLNGPQVLVSFAPQIFTI